MLGYVKMYCIVTHTDLDGIVSAAIYVVGMGVKEGSYSVTFIEPIDVGRSVCSLVDRGGCRVIAVMDLGVGDNSFKDLRCLDNLSKDVEIAWYDHHIWEPKWIEKLSRYIKLYIDPNLGCTASVVAKSLGVSSDVIKGYVDTTCAVDSWNFSRWEAPYLYRYADYAKRFYGLEKVFRDILDAIRGNTHVSQFAIWLEPFAEVYVDRELKIVSNICRDIKTIEIGGKKICIYYKYFDIPNQSIIGNAITRCDCEIAAIIRNLSSISFRSKSFNVREIARKLGGGGHIKAAGAPLKLNKIVKTFLNLLPTKIRKTILYNYIENLLKKTID